MTHFCHEISQAEIFTIHLEELKDLVQARDQLLAWLRANMGEPDETL